MVTGADLKIRLEAYIRDRQAELAKVEAGAESDRTRIGLQITEAEKVLALWDQRVETLIDMLGKAGIQVGPE